jgi:hypothetical protein
MFTPTILEPTPDPNFVRELKKIDADLRVVWGMERYFVELWTIERRIPPERYYRMHASLFRSGAPRFIEQPIFDDDQRTYNDLGEDAGPKQVGVRRFDLAPEWEWVMFVEEPDQSYRPLDARTITELKRVYAWERFHSLTRAKLEAEQEREKREKERQSRRLDAIQEGIDEAYTESGWRESVSVPDVPKD